jgi:hypothetical protein
MLVCSLRKVASSHIRSTFAQSKYMLSVRKRFNMRLFQFCCLPYQAAKLRSTFANDSKETANGAFKGVSAAAVIRQQ